MKRIKTICFHQILLFCQTSTFWELWTTLEKKNSTNSYGNYVVNIDKTCDSVINNDKTRLDGKDSFLQGDTILTFNALRSEEIIFNKAWIQGSPISFTMSLQQTLHGMFLLLHLCPHKEVYQYHGLHITSINPIFPSFFFLVYLIFWSMLAAFQFFLKAIFRIWTALLFSHAC